MSSQQNVFIFVMQLIKLEADSLSSYESRKKNHSMLQPNKARRQILWDLHLTTSVCSQETEKNSAGAGACAGACVWDVDMWHMILLNLWMLKCVREFAIPRKIKGKRKMQTWLYFIYIYMCAVLCICMWVYESAYVHPWQQAAYMSKM